MVFYNQSESKLSVDAAPFRPSGLWCDPVNICIFNNGEPTMTLVTEKDRYDILQGIDDDVLDQIFPPDAEEAFELETAEAFVQEMATLAMLEEREEQARSTFRYYEKRWEVRRSAGPSGRPRPAMHLIVPVAHDAKIHRSDTTALAFHQISGRRSGEQYERSKVEKRLCSRRTKTAAPPRPIVQPRKNS